MIGVWVVPWMAAWASPAPSDPVVWPRPEPWAGDATYDLVLEEAVAHPDWGVRPFQMADEGGVLRPLSWFDPGRDGVPPVPVKEGGGVVGDRRSAVAPVLHPGPRDGFLSGKAVYVSQCHGYIRYSSLSRHSTQRGILFDTVEDFHNPEGANAFLIPMLEHAGATVFTARERDMSATRVIVDHGDPGYAESGATFSDGAVGWQTPASTLPYGSNPFKNGGTRQVAQGSGGIATWSPDLPEAGMFGVYVSWDADPGNTSAAHYRITHPGGVIDRWFDQRVHGSTWQHVETLWLPAGAGNLTVSLIADGSGGGMVNADAVRIGGGDNLVTRSGERPPGARLWEMGAVAYTQFNGAPSSVYDPFGNGDGTDPTTRSRWAAWEHPSGEDAVYLSWHSNAASSTARGTITYFAGGGSDAPSSEPAECSQGAVTGSYSLARSVQDALIETIRANHDAGWQDRDLGTACFAEVNPNHNDEMPSALVELAFHDNATDAAHLKDPTFRLDASRAMVRGIVDYFADRDGVPAAYAPEPPRHLTLRHTVGGEVVLDWQDGESGAPFGDAPTAWIVETSADGRVWSEAFSTTDREATLTPAAATVQYARVRATNDGGTSFPSEVMGVRRAEGCTAPVLVIGGFDRFDAGLLPSRAAPYIGTVVTMQDLPRVNPADLVVAAGEALDQAGWAFDAMSDERLLDPDLDLSPYAAIWWIAGEESSGTSTITADQQQVLSAFVDAGGALVVSGAEVLWDLDAQGSAADKAFAEEVLGATMAADDAGTSTVAGEGVLAGVDLSFGTSDGARWPVEYPDVVASTSPVLARYAGGDVAGVRGPAGAFFGFPLEAVGSVAARSQAAGRLLTALAPEAVAAGEGGCEVPDPEDPGPGQGEGGERTPLSGVDLAGAERVRIAGRGGCDASGLAGGGAWASIGLLGLLVRRRSRLPPS